MTRPSPVAVNSLEHLSALADGQLPGRDLAPTLAACEQDPALMAAWRDYHLIGDVLRGSSAGLPLASEAALLQRLQTRLAQEGPRARPTLAKPLTVMPQAWPANDGRFAWRWVAGLAAVVAVGALGWSMLTDVGDAGPALAQGSASQLGPVQPAQGVIDRDAHLDELLAAHRGLGGLSALQVPAAFLRDTTFDVPTAAGP